MDKEWTKLEKQKAWLLNTVRLKSEVRAEARNTKTPVHFGSLMPLCHIKNYQLGEDFWEWKGRIVFRGDNVRDEYGHFAVFGEQGTS